MKRDLNSISNKSYDVIIIGGGIYGACTAWYASQQNLSVLLLDKGDFGHATSFNSQKIIHSGLRYLQHMDFKRIFESVSEARLLRQIAPNLVYPMPCVMPAYGHLLEGKEILWIAVNLFNMISFNRNRSVETPNRLPDARIISRDECLNLFPDLEVDGLKGGALWYDAQVSNSERLILSFIKSAVDFGAEVANYAEVVGFSCNDDRITGVEVMDILSDEKFFINGSLIVNTSGPWINDVLSLNSRLRNARRVHFIKVNLLITKPFIKEYSLGVSGRKQYIDFDAVIKKGARLLFITPWHSYDLVGTTEQHYSGKPDDCRISEKEIEDLIDDINGAYPGANLGRKDVKFSYSGLLPGSSRGINSGQTNVLKKYSIIDHLKTDGIEGLVTVIGVKFTTSTDVARKTVSLVLDKLSRRRNNKISHNVPIWKSDTANMSFNDFIGKALKDESELDNDIVRHLIINYGSEYKQIIMYAKQDTLLSDRVTEHSPVTWAELLYAIKEEMAEKLSDLMLRRTQLGEVELPDEKCLRETAGFMAKQKGWDEARIMQEISELKQIYQPSA